MNKKVIIGIIILFIIFIVWNKSSENMMINTSFPQLKCKWTNRDGYTFNKASYPCTSCNICQNMDKITYRNDKCKSEEFNMGIKYVETKQCSF